MRIVHSEITLGNDFQAIKEFRTTPKHKIRPTYKNTERVDAPEKLCS